MNYLVKMMDNSEIVVPEHIGEAILEAKVERITWNKIMINLRSISSVKPETESNLNYLSLPEPKMFNKKEKIRAINEMIKGLNKFLRENEHTDKSEKLLEKMGLKLEEAKKLPNNSLTGISINGFYE